MENLGMFNDLSIYRCQGIPYEIDDLVEIISTPGHTGHDISVFVKESNLGAVVIAGENHRFHDQLSRVPFHSTFAAKFQMIFFYGLQSYIIFPSDYFTLVLFIPKFIFLIRYVSK